MFRITKTEQKTFRITDWCLESQKTEQKTFRITDWCLESQKQNKKHVESQIDV